MKNPAVVLSLFDTGLGVIRSLHRVGVPTLGLDSDPKMPGFASNQCVSRLCPDPVHHADDLLDFLLTIGGRIERPAVLLPASDAFFLFLSRYRKELSENFLFSLPPDSVIDAMVDKRLQYDMAQRLDVPMAKAHFPRSMDDVITIKDDLEYPVFIKPYVGHLWRGVFGNSKGFEVSSAHELTVRFEEILGAGLEAMVQSIILGPNTNHFKINAYIGREGDLQALFTLRKIRQYPVDYGVGTCVESLRNPEIVDLGMKFLTGIDYRGVGSIEFKRDERDGRLKMIELNPRYWQQNLLATDCGINFPHIQYMDLLGEPLPPVTRFAEGVRWMDLLFDYRAYKDYRARGEMRLADWLRSWKGVRSFPVFTPTDMGPWMKKYEIGKRSLGPLQRLTSRND